MTLHIFDLDRTIWDTYDITGRPIWAKQMLQPYRKEGNVIIDDVGSRCVLRENISNYMKYLISKGHEIGFLSVGAAWGLESKDQPSINLLKQFDIYDLFGENRFLEYKTFSKADVLDKVNECVFYDDDEKHLKSAEKIPGVTSHDSSSIVDWKVFYER